MKIGIMVPSIFMSAAKYPEKIFAPRDLAIHLADELVDRGHQVWLFGTEDVKTKAQAIGGDKILERQDLTWWKLRNKNTEEEKQFRTKGKLYDMHKIDLMCRAIELGNQEQFDIMHYLYETDETHMLQRFAHYPFVYTTHDPMPGPGTIEHWFHSTFKEHNYVSISNRQQSLSKSGANFIATVHNGIKMTDFEYQEDPAADYLGYIGRYIPEKDPREAIEVALATGYPIRIGAGKYEAKNHKDYYEKNIKRFVDNEKVILEPFLKGKKKADFLGNAKAFIFPLKWEEPFGLVMIESMASGTPLIAYNRGAVSEIVVDEETGYIVDPKKGKEGLIKAFKKLDALSPDEYVKMRRKCRERVENYFSVEKMADGYEAVYQKLVQDWKEKNGN